MNYNKNNFLLTADAETLAEKNMLAMKQIGKVDVLKVGHHGSKDSTTAAFLNVTKPTYSFISVGAKN